MSVRTPILAVLSWASAGVANPNPAQARSTAVRRVSMVIVIEIPPLASRVFPRWRAVNSGEVRESIGPDGPEGSRRQAEIHQRARRIIIEPAGLVPGGRAHRQDEFRGLFRGVERLRVFAGKHS